MILNSNRVYCFKVLFLNQPITVYLKNIIFIILGVLSINLYAQHSVSNFTKQNGLPHDITYGLYQDSKGYVWIGTDDGLVKFNGNTFKTFTTKDGLLTNFVIDIDESDEGEMLLATWGGGLQFLKSDSIYSKPNSKSTQLKINNIKALKDSYQFMGARITVYDPKSNTETPLKFPEPIHKNKDMTAQLTYLEPYTFMYGGNLFYNQPAKGLYQTDSRGNHPISVKYFSEKVVDDVGFANEGYYVLSNNTKFILDENLHIKDSISYPVKDRKIKKLILKDGLELILVENKSKNLIQILHRDIKTKALQNLSETFDIPEQISDVMIDKDMNIWVSTNGNGVFLIKLNSRQKIDNYLQGRNIVDIKSIKNEMIFLSHEKLYFFKASKSYDSVSTGSYNKSMFFDEANRQISVTNFLSGQHEIYRSDFKIKTGPKFFFVDSLYTLEYAKSSLKVFVQKELKFEKNVADFDIYDIKDVEILDDNLFLASNTGISIVNLKRFELTSKIGLQEGLKNQNITGLKVIGGSIYVISQNGLERINWTNAGSDSKVNIETILTTQLNDFIIDPFGVLWAVTKDGITIRKDNKTYYYTMTNGLSSSYMNGIAYFENKIYAGGNSGVTVFDNSEPFQPNTPPLTIIEQNDDKFKFDVIDFSQSEITTELSINKTDWERLNAFTLDFSDNTYGDYSVQLRTRNSLSDWVYSPIYRFEKKQPWFSSLWGILFLCILSSSIISLGIFYQLKKANRRARILHHNMIKNNKLREELDNAREQLASDFHDELGNKLAGIKILSELMIANTKVKTSEALPMLQQINKESQSLYEGMKDFIWTIDGKSDSYSELVVYLSDFGENLFRNKGIDFEVSSSKVKTDVKLPHYWSRQILLLFKEAMTNALKHSKATEVHLEFKLKKNLIIQFTDNGKGFDSLQVKRKNGLTNMKKRAQKINAMLQINSNVKGTVVYFKGRLNS